MYKRAFGLIVALFGMIYLALALRLPLRTLNGPGAGFFPILVGICLVASGIIATARAGAVPPANLLPASSRTKILIVFASMMMFCAFLPRLGYIACGSMVMFAALMQFEVSWKGAAVISVAASIGTYWLFVSVLGLPLPRGSWFGV